MSEARTPKPLTHGLAVREGFTGTVEHAEHYRYHVATYDCKCGTVGYRIFVNDTRYDLGQLFQEYIEKMLEDVHTHNGKHP